MCGFLSAFWLFIYVHVSDREVHGGLLLVNQTKGPSGFWMGIAEGSENFALSAPESRNSLPPVSVLLLSDQFFSLIYPVCRRTFSCPPRPGRKLFPIKSVSVLFCTPLCQKTADWDMLLMTFLELEKSVNKIKLYCPWNLYSIESVMSKHLVQNLIKKLVCKSDVCDEIW